MPVNDFEKQVQDKMGELKLRPAEPVWENIEKEISKRKRKKRFFFLLPLMAALLLLGYTGTRYFMHSTNRSKTAKNIQPASEIKNNDTGNKEKDANKDTVTTSVPAVGQPDRQRIAGAEKNIPAERHINKNGIVGTDKKRVGKQVATKRETATADQQTSLYKKPANDTNDLVYKKEESSTHLINPKEAVAKTDDKSEILKKEIPVNDSSEGQQKNNLIDNKEKAMDTSLATTNAIDSKSEAVVPQKAAKQKGIKNSRWGFSFAGGFSHTRNELFSMDKSLQTNSGGNVSVGQGPITPPVSPSEIRPGLFVKLGLTWEKDISRRSKFSTGLQYNYFSDQLHVGNRVNSPMQLSSNYLSGQIVNVYYGGMQHKKFTDRYHFIEIPVGYQLQLNKNKNIPFAWNIGFSLSRLLSTNALVYDTTGGGVYYHTGQLFNKTHFSVVSGLALRFNSRKGMAWSIGPQWSIDMTRTVKEGFDRNRYLMAGYLEIRLLLPGKVKK